MIIYRTLVGQDQIFTSSLVPFDETKFQVTSWHGFQDKLFHWWKPLISCEISRLIIHVYRTVSFPYIWHIIISMAKFQWIGLRENLRETIDFTI